MDERRKIARWRTAGISVDLIAEKLGRHRSTIRGNQAPPRKATCL
jgi:IS30 family transposase